MTKILLYDNGWQIFGTYKNIESAISDLTALKIWYGVDNVKLA